MSIAKLSLRQFGKDVIQSGIVVHVMHNLLSCKHCILTLQLLLSIFCQFFFSFMLSRVDDIQLAFMLFKLFRQLSCCLGCFQTWIFVAKKLFGLVLNCPAQF